MNKEELYNALKQDGAKLRAINFYKRETLQEMYDERFGVEEVAVPDGSASVISVESAREHDEFPPLDVLESNDAQSAEAEDDTPDYVSGDEMPVEIRTLYFTGGGWCEETQSSYAPGYYRPATLEEYLALRKFAANEL